MKRKNVLAAAFALCLCFFFSSAKTNNKFICTERATNQNLETPLTGNMEISVIHFALLNI